LFVIGEQACTLYAVRMLRNTKLLWALQILLAALYLFAGGFKLVAGAEAMQPAPLPIPFLRLVGAMEVLGAVGLILPGLTGIRRNLTSLAAGGLALIMAGAVVVTVATMGVLPAVLPLVAGILDIIVMRGRRERAPSR
jgi:hypothetical protein